MSEQTKRAPAGSGHAPRDWAEREAMIARLAYFRAERRGFAAGREMEDWLLAEAEVDGLAGARDEGTRR